MACIIHHQESREKAGSISFFHFGLADDDDRPHKYIFSFFFPRNQSSRNLFDFFFSLSLSPPEFSPHQPKRPLIKNGRSLELHVDNKQYFSSFLLFFFSILLLPRIYILYNLTSIIKSFLLCTSSAYTYHLNEKPLPQCDGQPATKLVVTIVTYILCLPKMMGSARQCHSTTEPCIIFCCPRMFISSFSHSFLS